MQSLFLLICTFPVINGNKINFVENNDLTYQSIEFKEAVIDYASDDFFYVLTDRYIYKIDTINHQIVDRTPLPQRFNYLSIGKDEIFLILPSEIVILNKTNLTFKSGIGIEAGDYQPMISPAFLPQKNLLYLLTHNDRKSSIKIIDVVKERKIKSASFSRIFDFQYILDKQIFVTLDSSSLNFLDLKLKNIKRLKLPFKADNFFIDKDGYILTNEQAIFSIDNNGKIKDFQPVCLNGEIQNANFIYWNSDFMVVIDPFIFRIIHLLKNNEGINNVLCLDKYKYICTNREGELFLLETSTQEIRKLRKREPLRASIPDTTILEIDSLFYLQFGAFSDKERAINFTDGIREKGLPVFIDSSQADLYRIKSGGFYNKELALEIWGAIELPGWIIYQKRIDYESDTIFTLKNEIFRLQRGIITKKE